MTTLYEQYKQFEKLNIDATTIMLYEDVINYIKEDGYNDKPIILKELLNSSSFHENVLSYCRSYDFDWSYGLNYDDIKQIVEDLIEEYSTQ